MKKRLISILLTLLMVMSLFSGMSVSAYADDDTDKLYVEYTLAQGDYVLRICQKLGINYYTCKEAIMALNNITSENGFRYLSVGEVVKIPVSDAAAIAIMTGDKTTGSTGSTGSTGGSASGSVASGATIAYYLIPYTMQRGETVLGVCNSLGISFAKYSDQIMKINGISSWNKVGAGTTLLLPSAKTPAVGTTCYAVVAHKVVSGDTAYTLCQKYGVSYGGSTKLLQALNNTDNLAAIKVGKSFYMPVATTIKAQSSSTGSTSGSTGSTSGNTGSGSTTGSTTGTTTTNAKSYDLTGNINSNYGSMAFYVNNASVTSAKEGDVVTVNVTTKDGRAVESLTAKFADGRADVKLEANSFIMPACDVRVDAAIKSGYDITINSNYSFKTAAQVGGINVSSAAAGSSVKITSNDPGFAVKEVEVYYHTLMGMVKNVVSVNDQFCFVMPNKDVTVDVTLAPVTTYNFYRADTNFGSFDLQVDGSSVSKAAKGAKVTVLWQAMSGYDITELKVNKYDAKTDTIGSAISVYNNSFTMPNSDVYVEVTFGSTANSIDIEAVEGGALYAEVGGARVSEANTNETVTIVGEARADGYSDTIKELVVTRKADGHRVKVSGNSFQMPAGGVVVSGKLLAEEIYTVTVNFNAAGSENRVTLKAEGYENWTVIDNNSGSDNNYAVGTEIKLSTLARDSHAFVEFKVYVDGAFDQEATDMANEQGLLVMPNKNVVIEAYFSADSITIPNAEITGKGTVSYRVKGVAANSCKVGDIVEIIAVPNHSVFEVTADCITVINDATQKKLNVSKNANGNFEFQMPAEGVTIAVRLDDGADVTTTLYVRPYDKETDKSLQGKSLVEARLFDGPNPIVDNTATGTVIKANGGEALVFKLTELGKASYTIDRIKVKTTAGTEYEGGLEYVKEGTYRVWLKDVDVDVTVYLKPIENTTISLNNLSWNTSRGDVDCAVGYMGDKIVANGKVGDIITVIADVREPYFINEESLSLVRNSDGGKFTLGKTDPTEEEIMGGRVYPYTDGGKVVGWMYIMPEGGVTGTVSFNSDFYTVNLKVSDTEGENLLAKGLVTITVAGTELQYNVSGVFDEVKYNRNVKIALSAAGAADYKLKSVSVSGVQVTDNAFNMPAEDVTVEVILEKKAVEPTTVKLNTSADANGTVQYYLDKECTQLITDGKAAVESYVYVKLTPKTGYVIKEGAPTAKNDFDKTTVALGNEGNGVYSFKTGKNDITVSASFVKESYEMTVWVGGASNTDVKVTVEKTGVTSTVKSGDKITVPYNTKVTFAVADTSKYTLSAATASAGTMKNVSKTGANITMPASDVEVTLTLAAK